MCMSCVSNGEVLAISGLVAAGAMKQSAQRLCRAAGLTVGRSRAERDRQAVEFLRGLDLDPVEILGADTVHAVDVAQAFPRQTVYRRSFRDALRLVLPGSGSKRSQIVYATK